MLIRFDEIGRYDFQLSDINIFHQKPVYRELKGKKRKVNGFLYILKGECRYTFLGGSFSLSPGSVVYLPSGSEHHLEILSESIEFFRIDFLLRIQGEVALFSNGPMKMCHVASQECEEAIRNLADNYQYLQDTLGKTELMCRVFRTLQNTEQHIRNERLDPAMKYLMEHLTENIDCASLASLCCLSTSQFYHLFRQEYHTTPLEYRNELLMQRARLLLRDGSFTVTEISEMLGFESVSYFSRFFKKHRGISPSEYIHLKG